MPVPVKTGTGRLQFNPGGDLRSHTVARAVSSALRGLTSVFGMGTGVTLAVLPPETFCPPRRSGLLRNSRGERDNRFGWHYRFDSKSNALCIIFGSQPLARLLFALPQRQFGKVL